MRIAIVNDVPLAVEAIRRALGAHPEHHVAWVARDGAEAVRLCAKDRPDLVLMDLIMPVMDGVEATRRIMAETPCPILIVTSDVATHASRVFEALGAGALDVVATPVLASVENPQTTTALPAKIHTLAMLLGFTAKAWRRPATAPAPVALPSRDNWLVAIGSSAGGPAALAALLKGLPADYPAAIVLVQHIDEKFATGLADWLNSQSPLPVRLAREGDRPVPGSVLLAGTNHHLTFTGASQLGYTPDPADYVYRPSVDVFFESAASLWRGGILGVLLTGMGRDGAKGLKALRDAGHHTIAQDQATSAVFGMPKAAIALDAAVEVLPLGGIAPRLRQLLPAKPRR